MTEFPILSDLEAGALSHLVSCPTENTVQILKGWSTFAPPWVASEDTPERREKRCKGALRRLAKKGYVTRVGDRYEATRMAYLRHDWLRAVKTRGSSTRTIAPDDLDEFTFFQTLRTWQDPAGVTVFALCEVDALEVAFDRMSRRGVHNDNFRGELLSRHFDLKYDLPLSRDLAREDLSTRTP